MNMSDSIKHTKQNNRNELSAFLLSATASTAFPLYRKATANKLTENYLNPFKHPMLTFTAWIL